MDKIVMRFWLGLLLVVCCASCVASGKQAASAADRPYVLVLGTAQDGGLPQVGCNCERCEVGGGLVTSLLLVDPASGTRYLFDASPDLIEQVQLAQGHPIDYEGKQSPGARPQLFDSIFITHAHMGHYSGLLHLGREAYGTKGQVVIGTSRLGRFFAESAPWKQMFADGTFEFQELDNEQVTRLSEGLSVQALTVPHRDEYSDTVGFVIESEDARLAYLPDIDKWDVWGADRIEELIESVDFALLDGTFFQEGEIPGRAMDEIPHPFIAESMQRFAALPSAARKKIFFTHFNHTNPVSTKDSRATQTVLSAGFGCARQGMVFTL